MEQKELPKETLKLTDRELGHNIIHLIYPLRKRKQGEPIKWGDDWKKILPQDARKSAENENKYYYPSTYSNKYKLLDDETVIKYFHPSVHHVLFSEDEDNHGMKVFQYQGIKQPRIFQGFEVNYNTQNPNPTFQFEWMATEIYQFDSNNFLVVRLSLHENCIYNQEKSSFVKGTLKVSEWSKFTNRIRMNHFKYPGQNHLLVKEDNNSLKLFFKYVQDFLDDCELSNRFMIANNSNHMKQKTVDNIQNSHLIREPMAFVQALVTKVDPKEQQWNDEEVYQLLSIDDYEGESGGSKDFQKEYVKTHTYSRWSNNQTYYSAIDYGAVTAASSAIKPFYQGESKGFDFIGDYMYQHHAKHYLILVLLQLYYREELQEILSDFSKLRAFDKSDKEIKKGREVIDKYYNLNQHFVFDRLTNEIQGLEIWKFYQTTFATTDLYKSVQSDMQELNQRLIEFENKSQSSELKLLTVLTGITGLLGMNRLMEANHPISSKISAIANNPLYNSFLDILSFVLLFTVLGYSLVFIINSKWIGIIQRHTKLVKVLIIIIFVVLILFNLNVLNKWLGR